MRTLVIIDPQIAEMETLAAGLAPDQEVLILNAKEDGVEQIARYLSGKSGYDAIHLLSHGGAGSVQLGRTLLTEDLLPSYAGQLHDIGLALTESGDLLIYGCNVAAGDGGERFVAKLAEFTGADVAASNDLTGAAMLGANWVLETSIGSIEDDSLVISEFASSLAVVVGDESDNSLVGTTGSDAINGHGGDDTIDGGGGNDAIDGGAGIDTAIFFDDRADFSIATLSGVTRVVGLSSASPQYANDEAFLTNVEHLQFNDAMVDIPPTTNNIIIKSGS